MEMLKSAEGKKEMRMIWTAKMKEFMNFLEESWPEDPPAPTRRRMNQEEAVMDPGPVTDPATLSLTGGRGGGGGARAVVASFATAIRAAPEEDDGSTSGDISEASLERQIELGEALQDVLHDIEGDTWTNGSANGKLYDLHVSIEIPSLSAK